MSFSRKTLAALLLSLVISGFLLDNPALADEKGNAVNGAKIFHKCQACHTLEKNGPDLVGPNLHGILDRGVAKEPGYNYSEAMKKKAAEGFVWNDGTLFTYLEKPQAMVPGTYMSFAGLRKPEDRRDLIAYLEASGGHN